MARMVTNTRQDTCYRGYRCCGTHWGMGRNSHAIARRALKRRERQNWKKEVRNNV